MTLKDGHLPPCAICMAGKMSQIPFPIPLNCRTSEPLQIIHTDICGPMRQQSLGGNLYFVTFVDDFTKWTEVRMLKHKSDLLQTFKDVKVFLETQTGKKIRAIQSDNGAEYSSKAFQQILIQNGIQRRLTVPYTPQQNGTAERKNRTLVEMARCNMIQSKLPPSFWGEAVTIANYTRNRCPSRSIGMKTPYELWTGNRPSVRHFRPFGSRAFILDKKPGKGKFDPRSKPCTFVGYSDESKAYSLAS